MKYLITGGSGFIGTNLILNLLKDKEAKILNVDIVRPKIKSHETMWKSVNICNREDLIQVINGFSPDYVVHLAARTDIRGSTLNDYKPNTQGVLNLLDALAQIPNLKRVIFTSSMYVCKPGYVPHTYEDYAPHTLYGESKVQMEKIIKENNPFYTWVIIRPTSIWGPWFGDPYDKFFRIVLSHLYFHLGKRACKKTYGYIDNTIYQIFSILNTSEEKINKKTFYLGDYDPYNITEWANEIATYKKIKIPTIPFFIFKLAGWFGDILKIFKIVFPMTSFRLKNMTTDNIYDMTRIKEIAPKLPVSRKEGNEATIKWMKDNRS